MSDAALRAAEREFRANGAGSARDRLVVELRRAGRCVKDLAWCECRPCRAESEGRARDAVRRELARPSDSLLAGIRERGYTQVEAWDPVQRARLDRVALSARLAPVALVDRWSFQVEGREFVCPACRLRVLVACLLNEGPPSPFGAPLCRACDPAIRLVDTLMESPEGSTAAVVSESARLTESMMRAVLRLAPPEQEERSSGGMLAPTLSRLRFDGYRQVVAIVARPGAARGVSLVSAWIEAGCRDVVLDEILPALARWLPPLGLQRRIIRWEAPR